MCPSMSPPVVSEIDRNRTLVTSETELDARQKMLQMSEDEEGKANNIKWSCCRRHGVRVQGALVSGTAADAGKDIGVGMEE